MACIARDNLSITTMIWTAVYCHYLNASIKWTVWHGIFIVFLLGNYVHWALTKHIWPHMKKMPWTGEWKKGEMSAKPLITGKSNFSQSNRSVSLSGNLAWEKEQTGTSHWRTLLLMVVGWWGDDTVDKTHPFGVRDPGIHCETPMCSWTRNLKG